MDWKDAYGRGHAPSYAELLAYLPEAVAGLFGAFAEELIKRYRVYNNVQRFDAARGWTYGFSRGYRIVLTTVSIGPDRFAAGGAEVRDGEGLLCALEAVEKTYLAGYEARYERITRKKREAQAVRQKARALRERESSKAANAGFDPDKLNRFRWSAKLSRLKLAALYRADATGARDESLIDEVGFALYARCEQGRRARELLGAGGMLCHHCGEIVRATSYDQPTPCACGYAIVYRDYRRSFHSAGMPAGRASAIFDAFADGWARASLPGERMILIDRLIHECHVSAMSDVKGRSVCMNLIEGTTAQILGLLDQIAQR